jgi:predicted HTH domain antitoxin
MSEALPVADSGESSLVTRADQPLLLDVPLGAGTDTDTGEVRLELAAWLYDSEQISVGVTGRIAGLSYSEMIDALGERCIATIRLQPGELERELAAFGR